MWDAIKQNILLPGSTRIGTFIAGVLVTNGVASEHASVIGLAVPVTIFVGIDLMLAWYRKRAIIKKAVQ